MRIFIANADSYLGEALCADLAVISSASELVGTVCQLAQPHLTMTIPTESSDLILDAMLHSQVVVFDVFSTPVETIEWAITSLRSDSKTKQVFILISSVLTWSKTPVTREPVSEEEGALTRPVAFESRDWCKRVAPAKYQAWRTLESLVLAADGGTLKTFVICAGALYGNGERGLFYPAFQAAYWNDQGALSALSDNRDMYMPTVHVRDVARVAKLLTGDETLTGDDRYVVAVDSAISTQGQMLDAIASSLGNFALPAATETSLLSSEKWPSVDMRFAPSKFLQNSFFYSTTKLGFVSNIQALATEFRSYRSLTPARIVISGPPCSGKTSIVESLASALHIPVISAKPAIQRAVEAMNKLKEEATAEPKRELDTFSEYEKFLLSLDDQLKGKNPRLTNDAVGRVIRETVVNDPVCLARGYILDGFPRNAEEASALYITTVQVTEKRKVARESEEGVFDEVEEKVEKTVIDERISPSSVIFLEADESKCQDRCALVLQALGKATSAHHYSKADYLRRSQAYSATALDAFLDTWKLVKSRVNVNDVDAKVAYQAVAAALEQNGISVAAYERKGRTVKDPEYVQVVGEQATARNAEVAALAAVEAEAEKAKQDGLAAQAAQEEQMRRDTADKLALVAENERLLLEKRSRQLRAFLEREVLPTLTKGILEVCKTMPDDPIDYLAEYLFAAAKEAEHK